MTVKVRTQKDYLVTEATIESPCDLKELDALMKSTQSTGKIIVVYCDGGVSGINVEQRAKISETVAQKVRNLVGIENKVMNGH